MSTLAQSKNKKKRKSSSFLGGIDLEEDYFTVNVSEL